jgi:predicted Zn-dependent peptidase
MKQHVLRHKLTNGIEIAVERMPQLASASLGFWVRRGSRHEMPEEAGICHMIEHLLFKGTSSFDCAEIAEQIDMLGGNVDAFTSRESTSYVAKVRDVHFDEAFNLLASLLLEPKLADSDVEMEREVIMEELRMVHDTPDDLVQEHFHEQLFPGHPLGRSILGNETSLKDLSPDRIRDFYTTVYEPENLIITAAGNIDPQRVFALAEKLFADEESPRQSHEQRVPEYGSGLHIYKRNRLEQDQILYGFPAVSASDERRYALEVLSAYLGGSMSSRLFQEIREKRGLAYTIQSYTSSFQDAGFMNVYAATSPERLSELVAVLENELRQVLRDGMEASTLERIKTMIETEMVLGLESSSARMSLMARQLQYFGELRSIEEIIQKVRAVDMDSVQQITATVLGARPLVSILGPVADSISLQPLTR